MPSAFCNIDDIQEIALVFTKAENAKEPEAFCQEHIENGYEKYVIHLIHYHLPRRIIKRSLLSSHLELAQKNVAVTTSKLLTRRLTPPLSLALSRLKALQKITPYILSLRLFFPLDLDILSFCSRLSLAE